MTKIFTVYSWTLKQGQDHQFVEAWKDFAKWVTRQAGSLGSTRLFRDMDYPGHFLSVDSWENEESLKKFLKGTEYSHRVAALREYLDSFSSWPLKLEAEERDFTRTSGSNTREDTREQGNGQSCRRKVGIGGL